MEQLFVREKPPTQAEADVLFGRILARVRKANMETSMRFCKGQQLKDAVAGWIRCVNMPRTKPDPEFTSTFEYTFSTDKEMGRLQRMAIYFHLNADPQTYEMRHEGDVFDGRVLLCYDEQPVWRGRFKAESKSWGYIRSRPSIALTRLQKPKSAKRETQTPLQRVAKRCKRVDNMLKTKSANEYYKLRRD